MKNFKEGTRVYYNIPNVIKGMATIVGESMAEMVIIGKTFILQTDEDISNEVYPYKHHFTCPAIHLVEMFKKGDVIDFVDLECDIDGGIQETGIIRGHSEDFTRYLVMTRDGQEQSIDAAQVIQRHEFTSEEIELVKAWYITQDVGLFDNQYDVCCYWFSSLLK